MCCIQQVGSLSVHISQLRQVEPPVWLPNAKPTPGFVRPCLGHSLSQVLYTDASPHHLAASAC